RECSSTELAGKAICHRVQYSPCRLGLALSGAAKEENMQIITIYQGASGSGEELADSVAQALGYGCVDREVLVQASLQYGIPETKLNDLVEREPSWWASFTHNLDPYRIALQAAFCEIARDHVIVYHGHLGHELIPKFQHVLKVLL